MLRWLYTALLYALLPLACLAALWRGWRNPAYAIDLRDRLALGPRRGTGNPVWIHAVSVGEVQAAAGLVAQLQRERPDLPLLFTASSGPGMARALALYGGAAAVPGITLRYAPIDLPDAVARFLSREQPRALLLVEAELWPNWLAACQRRGIPVALLSARLSERSARRYARLAPRLMRRILGALQLVATQAAEDAERFVALGADASRVRVVGNLKFDFPLPADIDERAAGLAQRCGAADRWVWVAGSTHPGEEDAALAAHAALLRAWQTQGCAGPRPLLLLAPRRPGRFDAVADSLRREGVLHWRHSAAGEPDQPVDVWLLDTLGDLLAAYAVARVAYVGGTLVPVGGHNLLEPAALGKALLAGPYHSAAPEVARLLVQAEALELVRDAPGWSSALLALWSDPARVATRGAAARRLLEAHQGASRRCLAELAGWWTDPPA